MLKVQRCLAVTLATANSRVLASSTNKSALHVDTFAQVNYRRHQPPVTPRPPDLPREIDATPGQIAQEYSAQRAATLTASPAVRDALLHSQDSAKHPGINDINTIEEEVEEPSQTAADVAGVQDVEMADSGPPSTPRDPVPLRVAPLMPGLFVSGRTPGLWGAIRATPAAYTSVQAGESPGDCSHLATLFDDPVPPLGFCGNSHRTRPASVPARTLGEVVERHPN